MKAVRKVILITDISLSAEYNAGNKNAFLCLCDFFDGNDDYNCDILNFNYQKPDSNLFSSLAVYHYPDYLNLFFRKVNKLLKRDLKLINYKKSAYRNFLINHFFLKKIMILLS